MGGEFDLHLLGQLADAAVDHRLEQPLLAAELGVEGGERAAGPAYNLGHIGLIIAKFEENLAGGPQESGAAQLCAATLWRFGFGDRRAWDHGI